MSKLRRFPAVTGRCFCGETVFRLEVPPLFCFSCHCSDCAKSTGTVFACYVSIETDYITPLGKLMPKITEQTSPSGVARLSASCAKCGTNLWATGDHSPAISDVKVGVLDHPHLFEPDFHSFIEAKIPWVILPEGARTCKGRLDFRKVWPASSLKRYEAAVKRREARLANLRKVAAESERRGKQKDALEVADVEEADKTPTAQSPDLKENGKNGVSDGDEEDDDDFLEDEEEFERKYRETEKALQERLEKLTAKLAEQKLDEDK